MTRRRPIRVVAADDESEVLAAVPGSVVQGLRLARECALQHPADELVVKRGQKVLHRIEPGYEEETVA